MGSSLSVYDGLGRVIQTQLESDPQGIVYTDTTYDGLGRKHTVSNPYRSTSDPTYGLTTFGYDGLSRVKTVTTSDNAVVRTDYSGNQVTVTDQAGKPRRSLTDALGRLTRVDEPNKDTGALGDVTSPVQPTSYSYDALDDLKTVTQGGQTRSFSYDSLKRLTSATNPESGTVNYTSYDGNGNLLSKTDARGITTNYVYDALNRLTNKTYQNDPSGTPAVSYTYDATSVSNSKGRLTQVGSTVSMTNYTGYDAMGRVTASSQSTNGQTYLLGYGYNLAGGMTSETYPSGRVVNTNYDGAGRVNGVTGTGSRNYATSILYAPQGGMTSLALGNLLTESTAYNNRLQPTSISVGTLVSFGYIYGTSNNNGNVQSQSITAPGLSLTQTYGYDWLNRLTGMNETSGWSEAFSYDPYGNRTGGSSSSPYMPLQIPTINAQSNKISAANHSYDPVGNLTQGLGADGLVKTYTYDAENRLATYNGSAATYRYDGDGRRVKKVVGSATTVFVYDAHGQMVAEYSNQAPPTSGGTSYVTADHLGSTRLVTDSTGTVIARHDYAPFGEEISSVIGGRGGVVGYGADEGLRQKFTAKERDSESGLDFFSERYFSSAQGRFTSEDPEVIPRDITNPQVWNKYAYTLNNPLKNVDPDGQASVPAVVQQMLQKYAPTALGKLAKVNEEFSIAQTVLGGMHDLGMLPARAISGPQSSAAEVQQANEVARMTGNDVLLVDNPNNQGFDALQIVGGILNPQSAIPTELKGLTSPNPQSLLTETVKKEGAANGVTLPSGDKLTGVQIFFFAPNMDANAVATFAKNGPLPTVVGRSSVQKVTVTTSNGTVTIGNKQVTVKCKKAGDGGTCQ
jgi:RHS repeat-associated protein